MFTIKDLFTKDEASQLRQAFWTAFGQYLSPIPSAEGLKTNWINYKTGVKHLYFKMQADKSIASIGIEIAHPDAGIQELFFEQFRELKTMMQSYLDENWEWQLHTTDENGKIISRIFKSISPVSIYDRNDWPQLISFLKPRIIALDKFWSDASDSFDALK